MPTEVRYMLAWIACALLFITLIISLWLLNVSRIQNNATYGTASDTSALTSPHTPFIVPENRQATNVTTLAESLPDATRFATLLQTTGVGAMLSAGEPYTVFVPTDRALRQLPSGTIENMSAAQLKRLVQYHVVVGRAIDVDAVDSGTVQALSKDLLNLSINPGDQSARVNSSVVLEEYKGKNGIVYLINSVLLPPIGTLGH